MQRAVFLDRDGTLIVEKNYLCKPENVELFPGAGVALKRLQDAGFKLIMVTNQSGIARGMYTEAEFHTLMDWMRTELAREQVTLDAVYYCPFHPEHGLLAAHR